MSQDKDSLIGEAKSGCAIKTKQGIHSLKGRQQFSHCQESRASLQALVTWGEGEKYLDHEGSLFILFSLSFYC